MSARKDIKEYRIWKGMKSRCYSPSMQKNRNYQKKGIVVCPKWINNFEKFLEDMGKCPEGMSIDRIDNDGPYSKENCKWATASEQTKNRGSFNKVFTYDGRSQVLKDWARELGIKYTTLWLRLYRTGLEFEEAINYDETVYIEYKGEKKSIDIWATETGIPKSILYDRNRRGWQADRIFEQKFVQKIKI